MHNLTPQQIAASIIVLRGKKVLLDSDLAKIYCISTKRFNEQVKRNKNRFPDDFMFQITSEEHESLRSQSATSKTRGGRRYLPYVFTEYGVVMLASVLSSETAVQASIQIARAFISLREMVLNQETFVQQLNLLERKYDQQFKLVFDAIRQLTIIRNMPHKRISIVNDE